VGDAIGQQSRANICSYYQPFYKKFLKNAITCS
jgi:hypothetical protein